MSDLIKREDAIEALGECPYNWTDTEAEVQAVNDWEFYKSAIEAVPSADRPSGEWAIYFDKVENGMGGTYRERRWYCSACGKWQTYGETDFCPNCGARMKGADNE